MTPCVTCPTGRPVPMDRDRASEHGDRTAVFERERAHLRSVAFRLLGSDSDAEDAVQETWIRYQRTDTSDVGNVPAWLTTVVSRLCIDHLRRHREVPHEPADFLGGSTPTQEEPEAVALLAGELATAFTVVLEELSPPQRVALTLHDVFGYPFEEVAHVLGTSEGYAKKLASGARQRVRGRVGPTAGDTAEARRVVEAFLVAAQQGDTDGLLRLLAPGVVRTADAQAVPAGVALRIAGARAVVAETRALQANAQHARLATVDGRPAIAVRTDKGLQAVLVFHLVGGRIAGYDVIAHPRRLALLQVA